MRVVPNTGFVVELALLALALGGCCPCSVSPPPRPLPTARVESPFATSSSEPPAGIAELVKKAWATRDDRLFAEAFEDLANQGRSEFNETSIRLSADGRSVLVDAKRGTALLDARIGRASCRE